MKTVELTTIEEMFEQIEIIRYLYPNISEEKYKTYLEAMVLHNYTQVAVFDEEECVGLTGLWYGIKLWSGKYLEIDNFIVHPDYRSKGIGKLLTDYVNQKATDLGCTMIVLDAYTQNFTAHRFYYNQGYMPRGFHFVKTLNVDGLT
ncbi:GNAT family N-acetyltransferase [Flavobacterium sp.]|uniref:GNAT family N-acetyltransferase n=1 Tax=Flavobacterium sp. TaxID=239 RepID=UPI0037C18DCF